MLINQPARSLAFIDLGVGAVTDPHPLRLPPPGLPAGGPPS
ncbi:hypothetical protein ACIRPK_33875 [Kitasatospora sp. NPDC101801]